MVLDTSALPTSSHRIHTANIFRHITPDLFVSRSRSPCIRSPHPPTRACSLLPPLLPPSLVRASAPPLPT